MVITRRRQLGLLALLVGVGLLLWYWSIGGPSVVVSSASRETKGSEPAALDDVTPIGLDRLARIGAGDKDEAEDTATRAAGDQARFAPPAQVRNTPPPTTEPAVPPTPAEPTPPPMNVRFIGAVEVRSGVWVASLLTDRRDLLLGKEGDVIANRYRIVRIGIQSIDLLETASGLQRRVQLGGS